MGAFTASELRQTLSEGFKSALDTYVKEKGEELKALVVAEKERNLAIPRELTNSETHNIIES